MNNQQTNKAWRVEPVADPYYDPSELAGDVFPIVHADTRAEAISHSGLLSYYAWTELHAVRAREFDDKPLTPKTFLENGWWWECGGCRTHLTIDGRSDADEPKPPLFDREYVFCDEACRECMHERHAEIETENARRRAELEALAAAARDTR